MLVPVLLVATAPAARAACNLIPQAQPAFRGALGTVDRPFASPGDFVDVRVRTELCDGASPGIDASAAAHEVTLLFAPPGGPSRAVVLTTADCATLAARMATCEAAPGIPDGGVACVRMNRPGEAIDLGVQLVDGEHRLRFRFPDTDAFLAPAGDRRGFTGPVTIAVTDAGAPLPCGLATATCAAQAGALGLIACVDELYAADGTCQPNPAERFAHLTALPAPNDFQADCYDTSPPCTATATELRLALDRAGNILFPVHWQGVLPSTVDKPIPRLLRATIRPAIPIVTPDRAFLSSFTPEGQPLPPIFEPQVDPTVAAADTVTFFGSADAPATVLRIAHRRGRCLGGSADGAACNVDAQCFDGACVDACVGGPRDGLQCTAKKDCPGGACGALYDAEAFADLIASGGPLVIPRVAAPAPGICQAPPFAACDANATCGGDPCVSYAFEAQDPVALESLSAGSDDVLALTAPETLAITDRTGDFDTSDLALTVRNRVTGRTQPLGAPDGFGIFGAPLPGCGLAGTPDGRSLVRVPAGYFTVTALATEGDVVAFVESENGEGFCDENGDGDRADGILRAFTVPGDERTAGVTPPRAVDPSPVVNEQSLAVSDGKVFFRSAEAAMSASRTERISVATGVPGDEANDISYTAELSKDRRWVAFASLASNLIGPGADTNVDYDAFVRDRLTGTVTRVSVTSAGAQVTNGFVSTVSISGDGRFVVFDSFASTLVPGDTNVCSPGNSCSDVFLRDRDSDDDGVFDEPGTTTTTRISVGPGGVEGNGHSVAPVISADGTVVVFQSDASTLVADDTNGERDIFAWDSDTGLVERVNVGSDEAQNILSQGPETRAYDVSDDGRYVVFDLRTDNLPDGPVESHMGPPIDVFLRDRVAGTTEQVAFEFAYGGVPSEFAYQPRLSGDGRYVVLVNEPDFSNDTDIWIKDRTTGQFERVNLPVDVASVLPGFSLGPSVSDDGRFVAFWSRDFSLVPDDGNGEYDLFVRDRLVGATVRANLVTATGGGAESAGESGPWPSMISADGREVLFVGGAPNLLGPTVDSNSVLDVFIHGVDTADPDGIDALLFADGTLDDTVLEVLDAASGAVTTLCPAGAVAVANGAAAFLRPESEDGPEAPDDCPKGSLNGDGDVDDAVVQLWPGAGAVQNLGRAATAVALGPTHVAAIVSEAGEGGGSLNGDGDPDDGVLAVHSIAGVTWTDVDAAADRVLACGAVFAILTSEAAQGAGPLNGDGDTLDRVVQIYVPATSTLIPLGQAAEEILCTDQVLVFRTSEEAQDRNLLAGSGSAPFNWVYVMQGYDIGRAECLTADHPADCLRNSHQAVRTCDREACDPRFPYKVQGTTVKFVTLECDQRGFVGAVFCETAGSDLTGDLDAEDLVLQLWNVRDGTVRALAEVGPGDNPLEGGGTAPDDPTDAVLVTTGRCLEALAASCSETTACPDGTLCVQGTCYRDHRTCVTDANCPPDVGCKKEDVPGVVAASPDTDGDSVPDHIDGCVDVADPAQIDTDGDGIGDACDLATCGDGVQTYDETCEDGSDTRCPGACVGCRCAVCGNLVVDPKAKVQITTKNGAGQLAATVTLALDGYAGEPVTIALADGDSPLIARTTLGALAPIGKPPFKKWLRKASGKTGVLQVKLQSRGSRQPGLWKLGLKAKRWFTADAADQPAGATYLTIGVGTQCFRVAATKKSD